MIALVRQVIIISLILSASTFLFLKDLKLVSATYDEDFSYVRNSIYLVRYLKWDQEYINLHPPLMYYLHGWPFLFLQPVDFQDTLYMSRTAILPIFIGFAIFLFIIAKKFYGEIAAYFTLVLYSFNPEILAHSRFVTADYIHALTAFIAILSFYNLLKFPSRRNILIAGISLGLAFISKYSALLLIPIFLIALFVVAKSDGNFVKKNLKLILVVFIALLIIHASYFFKESGKIPSTYKDITINKIYQNVLTRPLLFVFPNSYLSGIDLQLSTSKGIWWGYFNGKPYNYGLWYFYPMAFLLKTPIPLLLFILLAIFLSIKKKLIQDIDKILLLGMIFFFIYYSFFNKLIIGLRYLLMVYPLIFLFLAKLIQIKFSKRNSVYYHFLIIFLLIFYVFQTIKISPHYLSFVNELIGGPQNAYKYFADSNLDWSQNTIFFDKYLKSHPEISAVNPRKPTTGKIAVSVNEMNLYYYYDYQWLRNLNKEPIDNVGYTWLIFDIKPDEIR